MLIWFSFFSWFRIWFQKIPGCTWTVYMTKKLVSANLRNFEKNLKTRRKALFETVISQILTLWIVSWLNQSEIPGQSDSVFAWFHWNQMLTWIDLTQEGPVSTFPFWQKKFIWRPKETFWPQPSFHICLDFKYRRIA